MNYEEFLIIHRVQLEAYKIPNIYWRRLYAKLKDEIFDAGNYFMLSHDERIGWKALVNCEDGILLEDEDNIFLVDHAWTYESRYAEAQLKSYPTLLKRMANVMDIPLEDENTSDAIGKILKEMWKFNSTYTLKKSEHSDKDKQDDKDYNPLWYVMDEFGSRIRHSDDPSFACSMFYYQTTNTAFTVMYPLKELNHGDEVTRDYVPDERSPMIRDARLYPWFTDRLNFDAVNDDWVAKLQVEEEKARGDESYSNGVNSNESAPIKKDQYKVWTDDKFSWNTLSDDRLVMVEDQEEADIIYSTASHFKDFDELAKRPDCMVNQFPNEMVLTCKDLFTESAQRSCSQITDEVLKNRGPRWLPTTFNLFSTKSELPQFIKCFKERELKGEYNTWIVKPWNLARSIGHTVTDNMYEIIRLSESGPKIVSEYVRDPVLFYRKDIESWVKFEFRFQLYVRSINPTKAFVHEVMYPRFGNKGFDLCEFTDYEKHWTNMFGKEHKLYDLHHDDMIAQFKETYPHLSWEDIVKDIHVSIRELVDGASKELPPRGLARCPQSRAFYGVDVILAWKDKEHTQVQPKLMEVNFAPDNWRACRIVPDIMNETYRVLFLDERSDAMLPI